MERTLYVTDLDGTLLTDGATLSPFTTEMVNRFLAQGGLFTYATARGFGSASRILKDLNLHLPAVTFNGTFVVDPKTGAHHHACRLDPEVRGDLLERMLGLGVYPVVYSIIDGRERVTWAEGRQTAGIQRYLDQRPHDTRKRPVRRAEELLDGEVFYMTLIDERQAIEDLLPRMEGLPGIRVHTLEDTYRPGEYWLEISPPDAGKDRGIGRLREMLGVDRVVCFGDNLNDIAMFAAADEAYAVGNAKEALKVVATGVIGTNEEDGVARYLMDREGRAEHGEGEAYGG